MKLPGGWKPPSEIEKRPQPLTVQPLRGLFRLRRGFPIPEPREPAPAPWLLLGLTALLALKVAVLNPHTTLLRAASTCAAIREAGVQVDVTFGEHIRLCGYSLPRTTFRAGEWLTITLYWQIDAPFQQPAYSFAHLLGPFKPGHGQSPLGPAGQDRACGAHPAGVAAGQAVLGSLPVSG